MLTIIAITQPVFHQYLDRGEKLVWAEKPPQKLSVSPGFFKCRFCDERPVCHLGEIPDLNCRTCQFSKPIADAKWFCNKHRMELPKEKQLLGCPDWHKNEDI